MKVSFLSTTKFKTLPILYCCNVLVCDFWKKSQVSRYFFFEGCHWSVNYRQQLNIRVSPNHNLMLIHCLSAYFRVVDFIDFKNMRTRLLRKTRRLPVKFTKRANYTRCGICTNAFTSVPIDNCPHHLVEPDKSRGLVRFCEEQGMKFLAFSNGCSSLRYIIPSSLLNIPAVMLQKVSSKE